MPIYTYECAECGVRFDRRQSFNDQPLSECPECEGRVHRLIQPAGVIFKGSGFYVTDNRSSRSSLASPGKTESAGSKTASESSTTAAPASSAD